MRRRNFITLLGGAAVAWPLAVRAQQAMPVIGWLSGRTSETDALLLPAFRQGLNAQGYVEGQNVTIEYRWADGQLDRLRALAANLARHPVAVFALVGSGSLGGVRAVQAASTTIPIVFTAAGDPVKLGLVPNLNRPGGNITGVTAFFKELAPKRLGLLHELVPRATSFAVLVNPIDVAGGGEATDVQEAAGTLGKQINILNASTERDLDAAFANLAQMRAEALLVTNNPFFFSRANSIVALAARHAVPTMYYRREFAAAGGLMSYGSTTEETLHALGDYTGRISRGPRPAICPCSSRPSSRWWSTSRPRRRSASSCRRCCSPAPTR